MLKQGLIYLLQFPNGKYYVGMTTKPLAKRLKYHVDASSYRKTLVARAIRKYGIVSVQVCILARATHSADLGRLERFYVAGLDCRAPRGYNLTDGGEGVPGHAHSAATKQRLHEKALRQWVDVAGRTREVRRTEAFRQKVRENARRQWIDETGDTREAHRTEEFRQKMREIALRRWADPAGRKKGLEGIRAASRCQIVRERHRNGAKQAWQRRKQNES